MVEAVVTKQKSLRLRGKLKDQLHLICLATQLDIPVYDGAGRRIIAVPVEGWKDKGLITPTVAELLKEATVWRRCLEAEDRLSASLARKILLRE